MEDARLLRGAGRFASDARPHGMLHAVVVRSPHAHAALRGIEVATARAIPGVVAVLTASDYLADGNRPIACAMRIANSDGPVHLPPRPPLAHGHVHFAGEGVALVVAETQAAARDGGEAVVVDYAPLPAVADLDAALAPGAPLVRDDCPGNRAFACRFGDRDATQAALRDAAIVVRERFVIPRVAPSPMEPRACVAAFDPIDGQYTLRAGLQDAFGTREVLGRVLGVPENRIRVVVEEVGGSFGLKVADAELALACWAARVTGRPVRWVADRGEALLCDAHGRDAIAEASLAIAADGTFLGLAVELRANLGAYATIHGPGPALNNVGSFAGVYRIPACFVSVVGALTNACPTGPYRGAGRPEASYVVERLVDLAARRLGVDPAALRRLNMIPAEAMPYRTALTYTYDSGDFRRTLDRCLAQADYGGFPGRRAESLRRGRLRGLGIASVVERAGLTPSFEQVEIRFTGTGDVTVLAGSTDQGQGHRTMYVQLVADRLAIDPARIMVVETDTARQALGGSSGSSRVSAMGSGAALLASEKILAKARRIAAHALEAAQDDIAFVAGRFTVSGTDLALDWNQLAALSMDARRLPPGMEPGLGESGSFSLGAVSFPNGSHACELEIDPETGLVSLLRYVVVDDVGTVINPLLVDGQIHGGLAQGIGEALLERVVYDRDGQLLTGSFMDYAMPRADALCAFEVAYSPTPTRANPLGVKGAGEAGTVGALPAVMNAVLDALAPLGVRHLDMPATSERIWRAIRDARAPTR
ncbi:MAG: xanthine dehydrogenase family protein [Alphaproteobacteria bacterium]|nr:xanthine dehydrogenase family protein [Alphaproteobacteria bacterium]